MQMGSVRYYSLTRPNARSIEAPPGSERTHAAAC